MADHDRSPDSTPDGGTGRAVAVAVVWTVAVVVMAGCALAAFVGYSSWGGRDSTQISTAELIGLLVAIVATAGAAVWITRLLSRR